MNESSLPKVSPEAARPFQFSLLRLFIWFAVICALAATYSWLGLAGPLLALFFGTFAFGLLTRRPMLAIFGPLCVIGIGVFLIDTIAAQWIQRSVSCSHNLKMIGVALQNYNDVYESLPPAYVVDGSGNPMHSWRVLALPFFCHGDLHSKYNFSEPWDGPNNRQLENSRLSTYACPRDAQTKNSVYTNYLAVTGPGTAWPGSTSAKLSDFDDPSKVILVVEVVGANVHWMEPRDLVVNNLSPIINAKTTTGISSRHKGGANVLFADGHVEFLPASMLPPEVQRLLLPPPK